MALAGGGKQKWDIFSLAVFRARLKKYPSLRMPLNEGYSNSIQILHWFRYDVIKAGSFAVSFPSFPCFSNSSATCFKPTASSAVRVGQPVSGSHPSNS